MSMDNPQLPNLVAPEPTLRDNLPSRRGLHPRDIGKLFTSGELLLHQQTMQRKLEQGLAGEGEVPDFVQAVAQHLAHAISHISVSRARELGIDPQQVLKQSKHLSTCHQISKTKEIDTMKN